MSKRVLIHDLPEAELKELVPDLDEYDVIDGSARAVSCKGCFGCWMKTPGLCVFKDSLQYSGVRLAHAPEVVVITRSCYGGYSAGVKRVFDRSILMSLPFFTYRAGRIHHPLRYKTHPDLTVYMYGDMTEFERGLAEKLAKANAVNLGSKNVSVSFADTAMELKEALK